MRVPVISVGINDLIDFLNANPEKALTSKYFELHAAVILAKFQSIQTRQEHLIAFPIQEKKKRDFPNNPNDFDFEKLMQLFVDENSPHDLFLVQRHDVNKPGKTRPKGHGFQLKRIMKPSSGISLEDTLVKYINEFIPNKYGKAEDTTLVLLLSSADEKTGVLDVFAVRSRIKPDNFPFDRIMIIAPQSDEELVFGEIWPQFGALYFKRDEFDQIDY